jgi:pseudouridylate synthase
VTSYLRINPEIARALAAKRPVVALESTIIAHGMAYPRNVETALSVEAIVREGGALPATIAVLAGHLRVGLDADEIEKLGREGHRMMKLSARDLPVAVARRIDGATTVAATMRIAALAGIAVFATGGIGGVHRGAEASFDVSADLTELVHSNVAVVTAGAKAILDLPLTLEKLETLGVPVIGFGTDRFPAFYSRDSGLAVPARADSAQEVAAVMQAKWRMGDVGGLVIANPIPAAHEIPAGEIMPEIEKALAEAKVRAIVGKEVTPFLLARLAESTAGRSLAANIALVENNARVAAEIATAYARPP